MPGLSIGDNGGLLGLVAHGEVKTALSGVVEMALVQGRDRADGPPVGSNVVLHTPALRGLAGS